MCIGCGACVVVCPTDAISIKCINDAYIPRVDSGKCIECTKCIDVCPGISIETKRVSKELWPENNVFFEVGGIKKAYIAYSNDASIRYGSTSGGIATDLAVYLLENRILDGVIVTKTDENNPIYTKSFIARTEKEAYFLKNDDLSILVRSF